MSQLVPVPLDLQLRRAFLEYEREGKIFDLPKEKFFLGLPDVDMSVVSNGRRAFTPLGPAAGPHTQLLQNIVLSWLGGARIHELKTVQVLDELKIPRPCIDAANLTYNVEWSQELKLEQSLREYVSAAMFLAMLRESRLLGDHLSDDFYNTIFDMSVGYNLEGIGSPRMVAWMQGMKDASKIIDELRLTLTGRFQQYRDLYFHPCVSDSITLSTFHGCPADEIERIVTFLLTEMELNVCVKMNPTLLGRERVRYLLHDVMGYDSIVLSDEAFAKDLTFDQALDLVPRLNAVARKHGKRLSLKFSNTLVVKNTRGVFADDVMYMSGAPLHVLTLNLVRQFRERAGATAPLSFSAGLTANNMADMVAMNFVPVTTCSDLLKPGGYGRLHKYPEKLGEAMSECGAKTIPEFVLRHGGQAGEAVERTVGELKAAIGQLKERVEGRIIPVLDTWLDASAYKLRTWAADPNADLHATCARIVNRFRLVWEEMPKDSCADFAARVSALGQSLVDAAGLLNTPLLVERATADARYRRKQNESSPRKIGSRLALFDCIACDKCVAACPNDANFAYEADPVDIAYQNYELLPGGEFKPIAGGAFKVERRRQFANFADACNDCGNCDVFCPEDGGPNAEKPRFFGSLESYRAQAGRGGFYLDLAAGVKVIHGTLAGRQYVLAVDETADCARFSDEHGEYVIQPSRNALVGWNGGDDSTPRRLDMLPYLTLKFLIDAVSDPRHVHYANVAGLGADLGQTNQEGAV